MPRNLQLRRVNIVLNRSPEQLKDKALKPNQNIGQKQEPQLPHIPAAVQIRHQLDGNPVKPRPDPSKQTPGP